ncbi:MAG: c-type cytochrome, partial [Deltaproteobacteria bacterium]
WAALGCDGATALGPGCDDGVDSDGDGYCDRDDADWSREATLPPSGDRRDIYGLGDALPEVASRGLRHTLSWPVTVSGVLLPWRPMATLFANDTDDAQTLSLQAVARSTLGFGTLREMYGWLGLPTADGRPEAFPGVAWPDDVAAGDFLGAGRVTTPSGDALSFSCATCHTANLFGRTVVGLTNRRAKANEFFHEAARFFPELTSEVFADITGADDAELALFVRAQGNLRAIGTRVPQVLGLDTSLAQVSLSLARRAEDAWATRDPALEASPRDNLLATYVADSKPAVWWSLKYKTRWLADGSIVSGNPVFTNFLWNELGRGVDLHELEGWLADNRAVVDELTALVFATEPPRWADYFGAESIDLDAARRGKALFDDTCARCHGTYDKGWEAADAATRSPEALLQTTRVHYHERTPVFDVGTDPQRARGMATFADRLNALEISARMGTVVEVQEGYVPPPLEGIWARYPYLHNQSVPTLCAMLSPASERPTSFWMGPSDDAATDFDANCVGYPVGDAVPAGWKDDAHAFFDATLPGLSNGGHDDWLVDSAGQPRFDAAERADLIAFLKTL